MRNFHTKIPAMLKALGVGGVLGSTLGIAAYHVLPQLRAAGLADKDAALMGAAITSVLARIVHMLTPTILHWVMLLQIELEVIVGWMQEQEAQRLRLRLQEAYYQAK